MSVIIMVKISRLLKTVFIRIESTHHLVIESPSTTFSLSVANSVLFRRSFRRNFPQSAVLCVIIDCLSVSNSCLLALYPASMEKKGSPSVKDQASKSGYVKFECFQVPMECKVVLVGDSKCGKSALIHRFANDNFLRVYTPTDFERCSVDHTVGDVRVEFTLWDTSGATAYDTVRPLCYKDARAFLLCFDVTSQISLHNALKKWYTEIRTHSTAPVVLCGCRSDLRGEVRHPVTPEQAIATCRQMEAAGYVETSAKDEIGVTDAFELCGLAALGSKPRFASLVRRHAPHLKRHIHTPQHRTCNIM